MKRSLPSFANINLFGACNMDCMFCLGKDLGRRIDCIKTGRLIDMPNLDRFLSICSENGVKQIYITGQNTDPLMFDDLQELLDRLHLRGFGTGIRTNGLLALKRMEIINSCRPVNRDAIGYSVHSLDQKTSQIICGTPELPDWMTIFERTTVPFRVSMVVTVWTADEIERILPQLCATNTQYIQLRKISTITRMKQLIDHQEVFEKLVNRLIDKYGVDSNFEAAPVLKINGKDVVLWRTVETTVNSLNYFADGTITDDYEIVRGYMKVHKI